MSYPRYSLCVLHYGDPGLTAACLRSTFDLTVAPQEWIVVWNDPQQPPDVLDDNLRKRVRLLEPGENLGFAAGANLGIRSAFEVSGVEALLLLNNDTIVEPNTAAQLLNVFAEESRAGMVGPRILQYDSRLIWNDGGKIEWPEGRPRSRGHGTLPSGNEPNPSEVDFICGCAPLIRKSAFMSVVGFDERYYMFYEDADISLRMRAQGWSLLHVPKALVYHHGSATAEAHPHFARYYRLRNRLLFSSEHAPDQVAAERANHQLRRRSRMKAWKKLLTGRWHEARSILQALADAKAGRWGRGVTVR